MKPSARQHFPLALSLSLIFNAFICLLMGFLGYVAFGDDVKANICDNFLTSSAAAQTVDSLIIIHELLYIPVSFLMAQLFFLSLFNKHPSELSFRSYAVVTLLIFLPPVLSMAFVPAKDVLGTFSFAVDITGSLGSIVYVVPVLLYVVIFKQEVCASYNTIVACTMYFVFGMTVLGGGLYSATALFNQACNSEKGCSSY